MKSTTYYEPGSQAFGLDWRGGNAFAGSAMVVFWTAVVTHANLAAYTKEVEFEENR